VAKGGAAVDPARPPHRRLGAPLASEQDAGVGDEERPAFVTAPAISRTITDETPVMSLDPSRRPQPRWRSPWLLVVAGSLVGPAVAQQVPLLAEDRLRLPAGLPPAVDLALADVDQDGRLDLVRLSADSVAVLLQDAAGAFGVHPLQPALAFPGAGFRGIGVGSFRAGGAGPDLVAVRTAAPPLILVNDGSGRFTAGGPLLPAPPAPVATVLVGDLDAVPPDDLLVLPEQGRPQLLLGQAAVYRDASALLSTSLFVQAPIGRLADIDGDGDLDVLLASRVGAAPFVLENAAIGFVRQIPLPITGPFSDVVVGDFDRDRRLDVALARAAGNPGGLEFVLNRSSGFVLYVPPVAPPLEAPVVRMAVADLLADSTPDLVILQADGRVRVALNDGAPAFTLRYPPPLVAPAPRPGLAVGDLEADGDLDVVVAGGARGAAVVRDSVLLGRPGATDWLDTEAIGFPIGSLPWSGTGTAVDFDFDGELDVVAYGPTGAGVAFRNDGTARFADAGGVLPTLGVRDVRRVLRASLDARERDLVVVASPAAGTAQPPGVRLLVNQAGRYAEVSTRLPPPFQRGFADAAVGPVLLPTSGTRAIDDLVVADTAGNLAVLVNTNGGLTEVVGAFAPPAASAPVHVLLTGDVDGDRRDDVMLVEWDGVVGRLEVYLRTGTNVPPLFVARPAPAVSFGAPARALTGDFDGDGDLDLIVTLQAIALQRLHFLAGNGRGDFADTTAATFTLPLPARIDAIAALGSPPRALLMGRDDGEAIVIARRQGLRYAAIEMQPVHGSPRAGDFVVADFDTDGDDDCAVLAAETQPGLLLGTDVHFAARSLAQARREVSLRARVPAPGAIAAWLWSPTGAARFFVPDLGVVRLAPPVTSLAVFPVGQSRVQDIAFLAPPIASEVTLAFQLAVFDPLTARVRLSNLEPLSLTTR